MQRAKAFTLMELLVVVGIIGVLASLLLSGLAKAQASANSSKCKSNLRQMGMAIHMYLIDSNKYPSPYEASANGYALRRDETGWATAWLPALPHFGSLWACPSQKMLPGYFSLQYSYAYNAFGSEVFSHRDIRLGLGLGSYPVPGGKTDISEVAVENPSGMIAMADNKYGTYIDRVLAPFEPMGIPIRVMTSPVGTHHERGANFVYCDGHVSYMKTNVLWSADDATKKLWNNDNLAHTELWPRK